MIQFKSGKLSKKEKVIINNLLDEILDPYGDYYITRLNLRLYIRQNKELLFEALAKGDKLVYAEDKGMIFVTGWSDNFDRKYVKILAVDNKSADKLLKVMLWNIKTDLYIKIKKNNPLLAILKENNYRFVGDRGLEVLLCRKYIPQEIKEKNHDR